jgi:two-component system, OmpR family, phosphate regulon sensor histidine kinase PhoR
VTEQPGRPTLTGRLLARYALTVVAVLAALTFLLDRALGSQFLEDLTVSLANEARAVRAALRDEAEPLQPAVVALGEEIGARVTVIRTDGTVVADSAGDPSGFENHRGRPEVRAALAGRVGVASRTSKSVGEPYRYIALPPQDDAIIRLALPLEVVDERLGRVRWLVVGGAALAALFGVGAVWFVARGVTRPLRAMSDSVARMSTGDLSTRIPPDGPAELAVLAETLNRMAEDLDSRIEEIRQGRESRDVILSALEEGVVLIDGSDRVGYANAAARRILGAAASSLRTLGPPALRGLVESAREDGAPAEGEVEMGFPPLVVRASVVPLRSPREVLLVLRDVTAARRVEAMRRDFVADASHELKTPAAAIQASAETLQQAVRDDPEAAARFADRLRRDAVRLSRIVSDLLDLSRLESERPVLEPIRLDRVVAEEVERIHAEAAEARVDLAARIEPATVRGSAKDLALLTRNLLDNAIRYTPAGGAARLEVIQDGDQAVLTVSDTGVGIPSRDLPRIFERFYRVDRARSRETGGTGLGLSIARHVVERHGGTITARSELGRGSTFRVALPTTARTGEPPAARTH